MTLPGAVRFLRSMSAPTGWDACARLLLWLLTVSGGWGPAVAHTHVETRFIDGSLRVVLFDFDEGDLDPTTVPIYVGLTARQSIPPGFSNLLGSAESPVWILPQNENAELPFVGIGAESIPSGSLLDARFNLVLKKVEGPGEFVVFQSLPLGQPRVLFSSRDGLPDSLALRAGPGTHLHCNWAFTAPGLYLATFYATGSLALGGENTSPEVVFQFVVAGPPPPVLGQPRVDANGSVEITVEGGVKGPVEIQTSPDLVTWSTAAKTHLVGGPVLLRLKPEPGSKHRFLRAIQP